MNHHGGQRNTRIFGSVTNGFQRIFGRSGINFRLGSANRPCLSRPLLTERMLTQLNHIANVVRARLSM